MSVSKRLSLIKLLAENSFSVEKVNTELGTVGYDLLTGLEVQTHFTVVTAADILTAPQSAAAAAASVAPVPNAQPKALAPTVGDAFTIYGVGTIVNPKLATIVAKGPDGSDVRAVQVCANSLCHGMVDFCRAALGDVWYSQYAGIKRPGGEGTETAASRLAGYTFAFETVLKIKLSVLFPQ